MSEAARDDYAPWEPEHFEGRPRASGKADDVKLPTAAEIEQIHQTAQREGYAAGLAQARHEMETEAARLAELAAALSRTWQDGERDTAEAVIRLAYAIAQAVLREALAERPEHVLAVVREAMDQLPVFARPARLNLHPEDAALVRNRLGDRLQGWQLVEDPALTRGDCRIHHATTEIDATLAQRWQAVAQSLGVEPAPRDPGLAAPAVETPRQPEGGPHE